MMISDWVLVVGGIICLSMCAELYWFREVYKRLNLELNSLEIRLLCLCNEIDNMRKIMSLEERERLSKEAALTLPLGACPYSFPEPERDDA